MQPIWHTDIANPCNYHRKLLGPWGHFGYNFCAAFEGAPGDRGTDPSAACARVRSSQSLNERRVVAIEAVLAEPHRSRSAPSCIDTTKEELEVGIEDSLLRVKPQTLAPH